jgi:hypothetical protein
MCILRTVAFILILSTLPTYAARTYRAPPINAVTHDFSYGSCGTRAYTLISCRNLSNIVQTITVQVFRQDMSIRVTPQNPTGISGWDNLVAGQYSKSVSALPADTLVVNVPANGNFERMFGVLCNHTLAGPVCTFAGGSTWDPLGAGNARESTTTSSFNYGSVHNMAANMATPNYDIMSWVRYTVDFSITVTEDRAFS